MAVPNGAMSDEQMRTQLLQFIDILRVAAHDLKEREQDGTYMTVEERCDLMKYIQESLVIQVVDFSHTIMSDIKRFIEWSIQEKRSRQ